MKKITYTIILLTFFLSSCDKINLKRDNPSDGKNVVNKDSTNTTKKAGIVFSRYVIASDNNSDGIVNKGETIGLIVYLKNTGSSTANKVKASITCTSSFVSSLSPTTAVNYQDDYYSNYISSGSESTYGNYTSGNNTLTFNVSSTIPSGTILTFNISITDESNNTWSDSFTITVQ